MHKTALSWYFYFIPRNLVESPHSPLFFMKTLLTKALKKLTMVLTGSDQL